MNILSLLNDPDWDAPFFKVLAKNDTGAGTGHQGGVVIPKDLRLYFPFLRESTSAVSPTSDVRITARLYDGSQYITTVSTRYQYQTWGGTRSAESRLTDQLTPIRKIAAAEDVLIFQRHAEKLDLYRLILVRATAPAIYLNIKESLSGAGRWGLLGLGEPVGQADLDDALRRETATEAAPFELFDATAEQVVKRQVSLARSIAFRILVSRTYRYSCSICASGLQTPDGISEIESAHVVPRHMRGADDARNGLALCRTHHWCFDRGLVGVDSARRIVVPKRVLDMPCNSLLAAHHGKSLIEAVDLKMRADDSALKWHYDNILGKYL